MAPAPPLASAGGLKSASQSCSAIAVLQRAEAPEGELRGDWGLREEAAESVATSMSLGEGRLEAEQGGGAPVAEAAGVVRRAAAAPPGAGEAVSMSRMPGGVAGTGLNMRLMASAAADGCAARARGGLGCGAGSAPCSEVAAAAAAPPSSTMGSAASPLPSSSSSSSSTTGGCWTTAAGAGAGWRAAPRNSERRGAMEVRGGAAKSKPSGFSTRVGSVAGGSGRWAGCG